MLLPCYRLMLLPLVKFLIIVITKIDNGKLWNHVLMADVIAICGCWNGTNV